MTLEMTLGFLERGPRLIEHLAAMTKPSQFDLAPDSGRFSLREDFAHLADIEPFFTKRIQFIADHPGEKMAAIDIDNLPGVTKYSTADPREMAAKFKENRAATIAVAKGLTQAQLAHVAIHPEYGPMAYFDVVTFLTSHDIYHSEHIAKILALS